VRYHLEHIDPRAGGGSDDLNNLALSCPTCNLAKNLRAAAVDPLTGRTVRLFNPRTDDWDEHFEWSSDCRTLSGRTAVGRATVQALDMNNPELRLQARLLWFHNGLLP
jgi:hypothetical protein